MARPTKFSQLGTLLMSVIRSHGSRPRTSTSHEAEAADLRLLDVVELQVASGRWPRETEGTVIELRDSVALVEIADERGHTLDVVELPESVLRPLAVPHQEHLAV